MQPLAHIALRAARRASQIILRAMDRVDTLNIEEKGKHDFVSEIDRAAEAAIIETIHKAHPDHGTLGEESGAQNTDAEVVWIIDPLDGTNNFLREIPHFSVSVAVRRRGVLEHGVIVDPVRNEEFVASRGYGAQLNGKRIRVSKLAKIDGAIIASALPYRYVQAHQATYNEMISRFAVDCRGFRRMGSAALDLAYVAAGRLDGYFQIGINAWDMAAGTVLVREAGGFVGDIAGGDRFLETGNLVASNPKLFKEMLRVIRGTVADVGDRKLATG